MAETLTCVNEIMPEVDPTDAQVAFQQPGESIVGPIEYARPTVREYLDFGPRWNWAVLAEREDWLFFTAWLCAEFHNLLNVLGGLNQIETPLYRWTAWRPSVIHLEQFCANLTLAPTNFKGRCTEILQQLSPSVLPLLDALIEETFALVEAYSPDIDTRVARTRYLQPRQPWAQRPIGC
jgi:hypothetical protein